MVVFARARSRHPALPGPASPQSRTIPVWRDGARGAGAHQVSFEMLMVGNFDEKSLARCAIFTATWRATPL